MIVPDNRPVYEGEIATYWFEGEVLVSLSKSIRRTVENLEANATLIRGITGGKPVKLLIYLADSPVPDKAARKRSTELLPINYSAMAMVSKPGLSQLIMSILFRFSKPPIPIKSFTSDAEGFAWLKSLSS